MLIGLAFDLRSEYIKEGYSEEETAEFDCEETIESVEKALHFLGHKTERIGNIWQLTESLARGNSWNLVFNIAEGLNGISRESQVPALLEAFDIPYTFSDPIVLGVSLHKGTAKHLFRDFGIPTPDFAVINNIDEIEKVKLPYPLFAKPIAEGTGKGISLSSKINNKIELIKTCESLLQNFQQPVLVETFLPGREFTVAIVGTGVKARVIGSMEVIIKNPSDQGIYSYNTKEKWEEFVEYKLGIDEVAKESEKIALKAYIDLNCRDAGRVDIRIDEKGRPNVMEINPLAGIRPGHSDLPIICNLKNIPYNDLIKCIVESASERIKHPN